MKAKPPDITILTVRDQKVVLDGDLALVCGVTTKRLNEQFRRNRKRFPTDFVFQLTAEEFESLKSQTATLNASPSKRSQVVTAQSDATMWSQIATTFPKRQRKTHLPWAFTEHGALQVANILRTNRAIAMSVYVIRAFIELREKAASNAAILKRLAEIDKIVAAARHGPSRYLSKTSPALVATTRTSAPPNRVLCRIVSGLR